MAHTSEDHTYFERERDRLAAEITTGFEELLPGTNNLNRKLEEVLDSTREYETIAALWHSFHSLMRSMKDSEEGPEGQAQSQAGVPGTGGHVLKTSEQR
ncbi:hypothetical protein BDY19DRAFT_894591 [Irpex rosettiformis]|uniref:Uncharacterized protein n=1 Tax=Irpex rosettiformis TaxID=378272 RepID=A0ACB8TX73_9APHY|nr:hypothetical protein BDY19DRAFT_894591 [Irpex rosettiformis]